MKTRYRIVTDSYAGFAIQYRRWWSPFWVETPDTFPSAESAERYCRKYLAKAVIKNLGELP